MIFRAREDPNEKIEALLGMRKALEFKETLPSPTYTVSHI